MPRTLLTGALVALFFSGAALAQSETPAEPPKTEAAPAEPAAPDAGGAESAPVVDWTARAAEAFAATYREACAPQNAAEALETRKPDIYEFKYRDSADEADQPDRTVTVYRFFCTRAPYNETHVFFIKNRFGEIQPLAFAEPTIHVEYENEDSAGKVLAVKVVGLESRNQLVNSDVDLARNAIMSYDKWRGIGDASSSGLWVLKDGNFVLSVYYVDASFDGQAKQEAVVDYRPENERLNETP